MENPPVEAARLAAFIGTWNVSGSLTEGDSKATVRGRWRFEEAANGWGVRGELETEIGGLGRFDECELIGFDPAEQQVHLVSMNRYALRDHAGNWTDPTTLSVWYRGLRGGDEVTENILLSFSETDTAIGRVVEKVAGQLVILTELRLDRQR